MVVFSPVPAEIKPVAHLLKLADEHESRNIVVTYWARMAACRLALRMTPNGRTPESAKLIKEILDWLEGCKKDNADNEGIVNDMAGQSLIEEYALRLFEHGDQQDRAEVFNKNTIKTFYTSGMLIEVLEQFGIPEELREKQRYAKWKAAFIHASLKAGERPYPGPPKENEEHIKSIVKISELSDEEERRRCQAEHRELVARRKEEAERAKPPGDKASPSTSPGRPNVPNAGNGENGAAAAAASPSTPPAPQQPGFVTPAAPATPTPALPPMVYRIPSADSGNEVTLTPDQIQKAQKYSKYATSALNYDDVNTAIENLQRALNILQLGRE